MAQDTSIPRSAVDAAIDWTVKLDFGVPDARQRAAFERWLSAAPQHKAAWTRVQALKSDFSAVPGQIAMGTLQAASSRRQTRGNTRRRALKTLMLTGATLGTTWAIKDHSPWQRVIADVSTRTGEQKRLMLADGTLLVLNTDSAVSTSFDDQARIITLRRGEISITTGPDAGLGAKRPFVVRTAFGEIRPLGTQFVVRLHDRRARVSVQQDAVQLTALAQATPVVAHAGESWWLERDQVRRDTVSALDASAWTDGVLTGKNMRLDDVLAELARYRTGHIACDPAVAGRLISDTYHVRDTDQALRFLAQTQDLTLKYRTRFWVSVGA